MNTADALPRFRNDDESDEKDKDADKKDDKGGPDIAKKLFESRTVLIFGEINMKVAERVTAQLLALDQDGDDPIRVVINSPGGHVESGDTIHDMLAFVSSPVKVVGTGWVASAGAHIFLGAEKQNRYCLPNTRFLLHQPMGGVGGRATDIDIEAREIIKMRERLNRIIAAETGQDYERVAKDTDRNYAIIGRAAWGSSHEDVGCARDRRAARGPRLIRAKAIHSWTGCGRCAMPPRPGRGVRRVGA